ncbi:MAG: hypothetical protein WBD34_19320, partial [Burkholderiaceae bacterium]
ANYFQQIWICAEDQGEGRAERFGKNLHNLRKLVISEVMQEWYGNSSFDGRSISHANSWAIRAAGAA